MLVVYKKNKPMKNLLLCNIFCSLYLSLSCFESVNKIAMFLISTTHPLQITFLFKINYYRNIDVPNFDKCILITSECSDFINKNKSCTKQTNSM